MLARHLLDPAKRPKVLHVNGTSEAAATPVIVSAGGAAALALAAEPEPSPPVADDADLLRKVAKLEGILSAFAQALPRLEGEVDRFVHEGRIYGVFIYDHTFSSGTHEVTACHELSVDGAELTRRGTVTGNRNHTSTWRDPLFRRSVQALLDYWENHVES